MKFFLLLNETHYQRCNVEEKASGWALRAIETIPARSQKHGTDTAAITLHISIHIFFIRQKVGPKTGRCQVWQPQWQI